MYGSHSGCGCTPSVAPVVCPPQYCVRDFYAQRTVPVIHPVVNVNRTNIVDVPQHFVQPTTQNVVVNQGPAAPVANVGNVGGFGGVGTLFGRGGLFGGAGLFGGF